MQDIKVCPTLNPSRKYFTEANFAIPLRWALGATLGASLAAGTALTVLALALFRDLPDTLDDVVDAALDDLLRDTGVDRSDKKQPAPDPKPVPPQGDTKERDDCEPQPVGFHLGHDHLHNLVADKEPPNDKDYHGRLGDWKLQGHHFDAYNRGKRELWEVKTIRFEQCNDFVKEMELNKQIRQIRKDNITAAKCGYRFIFLTTSKENYDLLRQEFGGASFIKYTDKYKIR